MEEKATGLIPWAVNGLKAFWAKLSQGDTGTLSTFLFALGMISIIHAGTLAWRRQSQGEELKWGEFPMNYLIFGVVILAISAVGLTLFMAGLGRATPDVIFGP